MDQTHKLDAMHIAILRTRDKRRMTGAGGIRRSNRKGASNG